MDDSLDTWFAREILVHEESLVRSWPKPDEVHDLRQDIYVRVYESALKARPSAPKSFLFTTARNLMTDRVRRGRIVSIEATGDIDALNVLVDETSPERRTGARQELQRLANAFDSLPPKCREVVWLRRVEELWQLSPFFDAAQSAPAVSGTKSQRRSKTHWQAIAAGVLLAVLSIGWYLWPAGPSYQTPIGGVARVPIADGSNVTLNTDSRIRIALTETQRHVEIERGEAFFEVAKDPTRPFVVAAGDKRVIAVGTKFSVRRDGDDVLVVVTSAATAARCCWSSRKRVERCANGGFVDFIRPGNQRPTSNAAWGG